MHNKRRKLTQRGASELALLERIRRRANRYKNSSLRLGIGDDCALLQLKPGEELDAAKASLRTAQRHALGGKLSGKLPRAGTRWIASYRWTSGQALTPVNLFDQSPGQVDPYFNLFLRQPMPSLGFLPAHMEVLVEIRNLLARGYVPVLGEDGRTLYLVQSARSLRGGVAFTF